MPGRAKWWPTPPWFPRGPTTPSRSTRATRPTWSWTSTAISGSSATRARCRSTRWRQRPLGRAYSRGPDFAIVPDSLGPVRHTRECLGLFHERYGGARRRSPVLDGLADGIDSADGLDPQLLRRDGDRQRGYHSGRREWGDQHLRGGAHPRDSRYRRVFRAVERRPRFREGDRGPGFRTTRRAQRLRRS